MTMKTLTPVLALASVLLLTGCSPSISRALTDPASPLDTYVSGMQDFYPNDSAAEIISLGNSICEAAEAGNELDKLSGVLEDEGFNQDESQTMVLLSIETLCPENIRYL